MHYSEKIPTTDPLVLRTIEEWLKKNIEVVVRIRRPRSGSEEFVFISSFEDLKETFSEEPQSTWFTVWEKARFPLRGIVDDEFVERCVKFFSDRSEYLIIETQPTVEGSRSWFKCDSGVSRSMLRDDLLVSRGSSVAVGDYPPCIDDRIDVIHVFSPDENGLVVVQPY